MTCSKIIISKNDPLPEGKRKHRLQNDGEKKTTLIKKINQINVEWKLRNEKKKSCLNMSKQYIAFFQLKQRECYETKECKPQSITSIEVESGKY